MPRDSSCGAGGGHARGSLTHRRDTLDDAGRAVEFTLHLYAASHYSFELHVIES